MTDLKKRYFPDYDDDDPVILHREDMSQAKGQFTILSDPSTMASFTGDTLTLLQHWEYTVITIVIDKTQHEQRYHPHASEPYKYCLQVMLERYVYWLNSHTASGDVMAEQRGSKEEHAIKRNYSEWWHTELSRYVGALQQQRCLTSCQIKIGPKSSNISGLQLADLVAQPSCRYAIALHKGCPLNVPQYQSDVVGILTTSKYNRSREGEIDGWGLKWLP